MGAAKRKFRWATRDRWSQVMVWVSEPYNDPGEKGFWGRTGYGYGFHEGDVTRHVPLDVERAIKKALKGKHWEKAVCRIDPDSWMPKEN